MADGEDTGNEKDGENPVVSEACSAKQLFGNMLRSAREVSGFSAEELANSTRISVNFIKALEQGSFEELPGLVFGRGFIKNICKALNEPPQDYLEAFEFAVNEGKQEASAPQLKLTAKDSVANVRLKGDVTGAASRKERGATSWKLMSSTHKLGNRSIWAVCAVMLVLGLVWLRMATLTNEPTLPEDLIYSEIDLKTFESDDVVELDIAAASEAARIAEGQEASSADHGEARLQDDAGVVEFSVSADMTRDDQVIEIIVKEDVRIRMAVDGGSWTTSELSPDRYQFRFEENVQLLVFDAAAVDISFNGVPLGSLGERGRVRRLSFEAYAPSSPSRATF